MFIICLKHSLLSLDLSATSLEILLKLASRLIMDSMAMFVHLLARLLNALNTCTILPIEYIQNRRCSLHRVVKH